jgi:hypothetical protein
VQEDGEAQNIGITDPDFPHVKKEASFILIVKKRINNLFTAL